ncbi:penicillin amidase [Polynucleobacter sp. QLW-P1DATA-2]|jgi:penicillin amidase|uniref:penicillin acylase family protein n=1 Tax=unclassified Polynucleobacter TaxID=2640945 RepID=UPI0008F934B0|nr:MULTISPECIES: penicillin acylase family protein [unclassified Polynucleobacter]OIN01301.1 penicillin amidase [Polynucleobacter sp. QLW-P1DATA-2]OIN02871.1 penicillin amidase [Polynucleobacter sp. MWH-Tro8-2-5-gr]
MKPKGHSAGLHKLMRPIAWVALVILILALVVTLSYLYSAQSSPAGKRTIKTLGDSVVITFDEADIPHIKANSQSDALFALGYLHATERSWQMEINRRLASGRLSEILGSETVSIDRFIRTLGIKRAAEHQFDKYPVSAKRLLQAYADGVNAGNANLGWALPVEYFLTGSKPGHWSPTDSVAWMLMMAYDLGGNWQKELQRLELSQYLSTKQIWEVLPPYEIGEPPTNTDFAKIYRDLNVFNPQAGPANSKSKNLPTTELTQIELPGGKEGIGSNNWALSGKLTATGKPLLANDPHLGLSAPAVWYFAHLDAPGLNVIGATLPGIPAVILGRTEKIAWSFTNTNPDVQDSYIEQLDPKNPGMYRGPDGMLPFKVRQEVIDIKGAPPLNFIVKETRHGPVISDSYARAQRAIDTSRFALALRWTALDSENQSVVGLLDMNRAKDLDTFKDALRKNYAPMQNVVMADSDGNIAYQAAGVAPKRLLHQGLYGVAPALGWEKQYDWSAYVPFDQLPASNNPEQGWLATANQRIIASNDPNPLTADWDLSARYDRIVELIKSRGSHDLDFMKTMQADTLSLSSVPLLDLFKSSKPTHRLGAQALEMSKNFNADMSINSPAALLFNAWADQLTRNLFSRLGYIFTQTYGDRNYRGALLAQIKNPNSPWCDDPKTQLIETCIDASNNAFDKALDYLSKEYGDDPNKWSWGKAHIAISEHRPLSKVPILGKAFNLEVPFPGDSNTINVGRLELLHSQNPYETLQAPSLRTIYDFSDLEKSVFIYQTGQSGWVQSKLYRNMNPLWAKNEYLPLQMKPENSKRTLELINK